MWFVDPLVELESLGYKTDCRNRCTDKAEFAERATDSALPAHAGGSAILVRYRNWDTHSA